MLLVGRFVIHILFTRTTLCAPTVVGLWCSDWCRSVVRPLVVGSIGEVCGDDRGRRGEVPKLQADTGRRRLTAGAGYTPKKDV